VIGSGFANEIHATIVEGTRHTNELLSGILMCEAELRRDKAGVAFAEKSVRHADGVPNLVVELGKLLRWHPKLLVNGASNGLNRKLLKVVTAHGKLGNEAGKAGLR